MTKLTDALEALSNTPGNESVGYAAADVNTAMIAAKFLADEHFGAGASTDVGVVLKLTEVVMARVPSMESAMQVQAELDALEEAEAAADDDPEEGADPAAEVLP